MSILDKITRDEKAPIILSVIWGIGLAILFRRSCRNRQCMVVKGPKPEEMENKIYSFDDKCYKYTAKTTTCKIKDIPSSEKGDGVQIIETRSILDTNPLMSMFKK
jgi:hypothetical protein